MIEKWRFCRMKLQVLYTISLVLIIFVLLLSDNFKSKLPLHPLVLAPRLKSQSHNIERPVESKLTRELLPEDGGVEGDSAALPAPREGATFDDRVKKFLGDHDCKIQFFYTWISSPVENFEEREFSAMESIFKSHPKGCLVILSETMDSLRGVEIVKPLVEKRYRVLAVTPDLGFLLRNTPGEAWFDDIKHGRIDPGRIPFAQNLSNLVRLAVLHKYGGVYLDTDFIVLRDFSGLRNSIGAQGVNKYGNWTILNNAVLVFDKNHSLLYKFMEEFASNFDGNVWGHNGPYLVSRVLKEVAPPGPKLHYEVLDPAAFYPVDWIKIPGLFARPKDRKRKRWVEAKLVQLRASYGLHLWNRETRKLRIEEGSIIGRLISDHCVICRKCT